MRGRDWVAACSAAAVLGVGLGTVHSGLTGSDGPPRRIGAGAASDAGPAAAPADGLPTPSEQVWSPAPPATAGSVRQAPALPSTGEAEQASRSGRRDEAKAGKPGKGSRQERDDKDGDRDGKGDG